MPLPGCLLGKLGEYTYGCLVLLIYLLALRGSFGILST